MGLVINKFQIKALLITHVLVIDKLINYQNIGMEMDLLH